MFLERLETYPALPTKHVLHLNALHRFSQVTNSAAFYLAALKDSMSDVAKLFVQPVLNWVIGKDTGIAKDGWNSAGHCSGLRARLIVKRRSYKSTEAFCSTLSLKRSPRRFVGPSICRSYVADDGLWSDGLCQCISISDSNEVKDRCPRFAQFSRASASDSSTSCAAMQNQPWTSR